MQYNSYGTDLYVNVRKDVFRKSFFVDVRLGAKFASGISSTGEKVYRMSIFIEYRKSIPPK